jgi:hypothetical protein
MATMKEGDLPSEPTEGIKVISKKLVNFRGAKP